MIDVFKYNREAWDRAVETGDRWTVPVGPEAIAAAREGRWEIVLTPRKPVPRDWFPAELAGCRVLCLASGGGQQGPILAAAGAEVTVFDASPRQLAQDRMVAEREGLAIETIEGDMRDLGAFPDAHFDLIFHPCSNCFCPEIRPVWRECARVLRRGGALLAGFAQPIVFCFDFELEKERVLQVKYRAPFSDLTSLTEEERRRFIPEGEPLCYGHSLDDQIGGQLDAGLLLAGFYEDYHVEGDVTAEYFPGFLATRAIKPG